MPEGVRLVTRSAYVASLYELLKGYSNGRIRSIAAVPIHIARPAIYSIEGALERLRRMLGFVPEWTALEKFLPEDMHLTGAVRSAIAATFVATLEMVRVGQAEMQQHEAFSPIYLRGGKPDQLQHSNRES